MDALNRKASFSDTAILVLLLLLFSSFRGSAELVNSRRLQAKRPAGHTAKSTGFEKAYLNGILNPSKKESVNSRRLQQFQQPAPQLDAFGRPLFLADPRQQSNQFQQPVSGIQFDPVTGQAFIVDPNTGQRLLVDPNTGRPIQQTPSVQFDPVTGQAFMIDPSTGQRIFVDPNTGRPIQQTPSVQFDAVTGQYFMIDPSTGQRIFVDPITGQPIDNQGIPPGNGFVDPPTNDGGFFPPPIQNPIPEPPEESREGVRLQFDTLSRKTFVVDPATGQQLFIGFEPGEASVKVHLPSGLTYVLEPATGRVIPLQMRVDPRALEAVRGVLTDGRTREES